MVVVGATYPVHVDATLDPQLNRWLWLVKWLLVIPHYVVLSFLWVAFVMTSLVAFFSIVFTGRYPDALFDFNVGVLRWTWRVAYYSYGALGTDRYPPFTLAEVESYPAHLNIDRPEHLSRGLVLIKWWLLAIPQYAVVSVFVGGGLWAGWETDRNPAWWGPGGLIGLLVLIAAIVLGVTGSYPRQIFDFVLGLNRWALRVAAYAGLMTDQYPPFRLDMGAHEMDSSISTFSGGAGGLAFRQEAAPGAPAEQAAVVLAPPPRLGWTAPRIVSVVVGSILLLVSLGLLAGGGAATWLDNTQRDSFGYLTSDAQSFATSGYAITSDRIALGTSDIVAPSKLLGTVRFRVTASDPRQAIFVGIAPEQAVERYLAGVSHATITNWTRALDRFPSQIGTPPRVLPSSSSIWVASASGAGTQTLTWKPTGGDWRVVVMYRDARPGVSVTADAGATLPALGWIAGGLFAAGGVLLLAGILLLVIPIVKVSRRTISAPVDQRGIT